MKIGLKLAAMFVLAGMLSLIACGESLQSFTKPSTPTTAPATTTTVMTLSDEARLEAMITQHKRVRSQLPAEYQQELVLTCIISYTYV